MRMHGTLTKWNAARGFGFILPAQGVDEIFVHISAFPRDGVPPQPGELLAFEISQGPDGRKRAQRVTRANSQPRPARREPARSRHSPPRHGKRSRATLAVVALAGILATLGYARWRNASPSASIAPVHATPAAKLEAPTPRFSCDGRTMCSQMRSCAEATYFLKNCPGTKMDGDGDGEPCESQWCG